LSHNSSVITEETLLVRNDALVAAPMGTDVAMMDMDSGKYFVLHEVAAFIWERLASPATPAELCDALMQRYKVTAERCRADVLPFLQQAHDKGLVRRAG
jgi:hypothetical protein